jgi:hypothetical protein
MLDDDVSLDFNDDPNEWGDPDDMDPDNFYKPPEQPE